MKIYARKLYSSSVLAAENITHEFDKYLDQNIGIIFNMLNQQIQTYPNYAYDAYAPYIDHNNIMYHVTDDQQGNVRIKILLKVPYENLILYNILLEGKKYEKYAKYVPQYVESSHLSATRVYQVVFSTWVFVRKDDTDSTLSDQIIEELNTRNRYDFSYSSYYGIDGKIHTVQFDDFLDHVRSKYTKSKTSTYDKMVKQLRLEAEDGINSIYEQTDSGDYIANIVEDVEDSMGVWSEISMRGGIGSIIFMNKDTDDILMVKDYQEYCDDIIDIAIESKSKKDLIYELKQYYEDML